MLCQTCMRMFNGVFEKDIIPGRAPTLTHRFTRFGEGHQYSGPLGPFLHHESFCSFRGAMGMGCQFCNALWVNSDLPNTIGHCLQHSQPATSEILGPSEVFKTSVPQNISKFKTTFRCRIDAAEFQRETSKLTGLVLVFPKLNRFYLDLNVWLNSEKVGKEMTFLLLHEEREQLRSFPRYRC
jgi:hypothetical protein